MRLFIALELAADLRARLLAWREPWLARAPRLRWTRPENWHVTLLFLGETSAAALPRIETGLHSARADAFAWQLSRLGAFPHLRRPATLWAGVGQGAAEIAGLGEKVARALAGHSPPAAAALAAGSPSGFTPHLTLARALRPADLRPLLPLLEEPPPAWGEQESRDFVLYESRSAPGGVVYVPLSRFPLA